MLKEKLMSKIQKKTDKFFELSKRGLSPSKRQTISIDAIKAGAEWTYDYWNNGIKQYKPALEEEIKSRYTFSGSTRPLDITLGVCGFELGSNWAYKILSQCRKREDAVYNTTTN